jgi:hypothetical protein
MNYKIETLPIFDKQVKRLSKKYPSLKNDLTFLIGTLEVNPETGISLGNNFYKVRLKITSKGQGKSGGARVITYLKVIKNVVYLSFIFDKSEKSNITDKELLQIFKQIPNRLSSKIKIPFSSFTELSIWNLQLIVA